MANRSKAKFDYHTISSGQIPKVCYVRVSKKTSTNITTRQISKLWKRKKFCWSLLLGLLQNLKDRSSSAEIHDCFIVSIIFICHIDTLSIMLEAHVLLHFQQVSYNFLTIQGFREFAKVDHEACGFMSCNKDFSIIIFWGHSMSENSNYKCNWAKYHLSLVLHHYYKTMIQTCVVQFLLKID